uniref:Uncharacterized protein n=1 Tax=virus sp. ctML55 TaxID=2827627 RepID=A0A8S5RJ84_9VIRU|nr:MAG TPA: hypothetical protein [virus sp. ctML55]DAG30370.1 MAG TPA: hypothetical protein [Bacteriophage sp.]DAV60013.1 MAG TPA: hypothetical protein [Caudoviricetes sp.]DAW92033.1 MAG TPA: hypothetical protein [Bacteriophage sp.]
METTLLQKILRLIILFSRLMTNFLLRKMLSLLMLLNSHYLIYQIR